MVVRDSIAEEEFGIKKTPVGLKKVWCGCPAPNSLKMKIRCPFESLRVLHGLGIHDCLASPDMSITHGEESC